MTINLPNLVVYTKTIAHQSVKDPLGHIHFRTSASNHKIHLKIVVMLDFIPCIFYKSMRHMAATIINGRINSM